MVIAVIAIGAFPYEGARKKKMTAAQQAARHAATHNEGGFGYNPHAAAVEQEARAKAEARIQHIIDNIGTYRPKWAAAVAKHSKGGQINVADLAKIEAEAGVTSLEIQAVKSRMAAK
ncbi:hypothetical protein AVME950_02320 [Acidovorax sp. SUPP950]|uniref:hypothetical protein n=1 Tax=Acidovorax sp. SUPP950 TaxID=511901 RepID=UPI0023D0B4E5|nr:hypothetical protein [Acidovorax sp. SUPP950]GKS73682.1 hypothetical protein AVME950_02320 [Acidovorax sp. SUPP950]